MKLADFFVQISVKGDLKELQTIAIIQKKAIELQKQTNKELAAKVKLVNSETKHLREQNKQSKLQLSSQNQMIKNLMKISSLNGKSVLQVLGMGSAFGGVTAAIVAAAAALDLMVMRLAKANQLYTNFQRQTGISMRSPIGISGAMANLDVTMSPEEIMQNMQTLQNNLTGIQFGMGNVAPYQIAGIQAWGASADVMMDVIRQRMKQFAPAMRTFLLQQMGLDPRLGALADLSDEEYLKYKKEGMELYLSPQDRKEIQEMSANWNKVGLKWIKAIDKTTLALGKMFDSFLPLLSNLADLLAIIVETFGTVLAPVFEMLNIILRPFYLIIEDLLYWLMGKTSLFGEVLSGKVKLGDYAETAFEPLIKIADEFKKMVESRLDTLTITLLPKLVNLITGLTTIAGAIMGGIIGSMVGGIGGAVVGVGVGAGLGLAPKAILQDELNKLILDVKKQTGDTNNNLAANYNLNVSANTIADAVGIGQSLKPLLMRTTAELSSGVMA